jgi:signal transduction histidine kinase
MSSSYSLQFIELCRVQLTLLGDSLGAESGIVYMAQTTTNGQEPKLEPLVSYPAENQTAWSEDLGIGKLLSGDNEEDPEMMLSDMVASNPDLTAAPRQQPLRKWPPQKLLQPLAHEGMILGLLLAVRFDRPWQEQERQSIEQISHTVALAAIIDRERYWATQALREQQQLQGRQQKLLDNLLHQLRNPLTAIYTFGKLLLKKLPADDVNHRVALNITRESEHLKELLQQLDDLAGTRQIAAAAEDLLLPMGEELTDENRALPLLPPASLQLQACSVVEILEPILANAAVVAQEKQLAFAAQIPTTTPPVLASASALREVLGNLVDNALKYTLQGAVLVTVGCNEQQLSIIISDSGLGIPEIDLPRLFQRSYRGVQASGNIPGTGLGLSIAKELLEQMGGQIQVASPISYDAQGVGVGSRFTVLLPLA